MLEFWGLSGATTYYGRPHYPRSYYQPYYGPVGTSINFGYSRGYGHWR